MFYKPSYVPQNGAANILVRHLAEQLGLKLNKKYEIVLASFLAVAKKVNGQAFDWWTGNQNKNPKLWGLFPHVTNTSVRKVFKLLEENEYIVSSTEFTNNFAVSMDFKKPNWVKAQRLPKHFLEAAKFVENNLPLILVNKPEFEGDTKSWDNQCFSMPKFDNNQVQQKFGRDYTFAYRPVLEMNAYWEQHPLYNLVQDEFYSSSIRLFRNGSIKSGSRWYGGWTVISPDQRFRLSIDGQPIVNIHINAMILALLSSLTGKPMNIIGTFEDIYSAVVFQLAGVSNAREKVKKVIMELIGAGNPYKKAPSQDNDILNCTEEFIQIRDLCLQAYPALKCLDEKSLNLLNDLFFHEDNIITQIMLTLKQLNVVSYPISDGFIVKLGDEVKTVDTIKSVFKSYVASFQKCNNLPELDFDIALVVKFNPTNEFIIQGYSS